MVTAVIVSLDEYAERFIVATRTNDGQCLFFVKLCFWSFLAHDKQKPTVKWVDDVLA
jgi:hypothetical protein